MPLIALVLLAGATLALVFFSRKGEAAQMKPQAETKAESPTLADLFREIGTRRGVDPDLLHAIAMVESSLRVDAVRWNPPHDVSVGLMQILCTPPDGAAQGADFSCTNRFNIDPWPVRFNDLKTPALNIDLGAQILSWNLRSFGFPRGVAVYNMWAMRHAAIDGPFENQAYVDKVLSNLQKLKGAQ